MEAYEGVPLAEASTEMAPASPNKMALMCRRTRNYNLNTKPKTYLPSDAERDAASRLLILCKYAAASSFQSAITKRTSKKKKLLV